MQTLEKKSLCKLIRKLPLLDFTEAFFDKTNFNDTLIIAVQHLYATTYNMFNKLYKLGLDPKNLFVVGKCYSSDPKVISQLEKDGAHVSPLSSYFDSHSPYDSDFERKIEDFFNNVIDSISLDKFKKIIVLDDGGFLCRFANRKLPKKSHIIGIEQTSAGYNRIKQEKVFFPVINAARSHIKMVYESPIIINLALRKLHEKISHIKPTPKNILIMGGGTLGSIVRKNLQESYNITTYDLIPEKTQISSENLQENLNKFDLIIGATGETSLTEANLSHLKKPVVLASISSSDREFDVLNLRKQSPKISECHTDLEIEGITLLNCGFPVNFDQDYDAIDTDNFQLTRSFMLAAICQANNTSSTSPGFINLDSNFQNALEEKLKTEDLL